MRRGGAADDLKCAVRARLPHAYVDVGQRTANGDSAPTSLKGFGAQVLS